MAGSDSKNSNIAQIDGNTLAAKSLSRFGATHMFGVVGIPLTSLANRAVQLGIRFIAFHNELAAGDAASAYGYLTGKPGLILTVSGPGCVHGLAGLSNGTINTWPIVMISGSCDQKDFGGGDFQELDRVEAVKPFLKFSVKAKDIKDVPKCIAQVLDRAVSRRPGGCYLDLTTDVLHQTISEAEAENLLKDAENAKETGAQLVKDVVPFNFLTPMRIMRDAILGVGSPAPILVSEGVSTVDVGRAVLVQTEPRYRLDAGTWGTMGVGLGYCIAAAIACPDQLVVAVEGGSGFGFSAVEVEKLVRYQLPVVVVVFDNGGVMVEIAETLKKLLGLSKMVLQLLPLYRVAVQLIITSWKLLEPKVV